MIASSLSMGFSRQECWSGLPLPLPGDLPNRGIEPMSPVSPALQILYQLSIREAHYQHQCQALTDYYSNLNLLDIFVLHYSLILLLVLFPSFILIKEGIHYSLMSLFLMFSLRFFTFLFVEILSII